MSDLPSNYNGVGFEANTPFLQILPYLLKSQYSATSDPTDPSNANAGKAGLLAEPGTTVSMATYLTTYFSSPNVIAGPNPVNFPRDWPSFINTYRKANNLGNYDPATDPAFNGFLEDFVKVLHLPADIPGLGTTTDSSSPSAQLFLDAFANFLGQYKNPLPASFGGIDALNDQWHDYLTRIALVQDQYQTAFDAYFTGVPNATFQAIVSNFMNKELNDNKVFVPSQSYGDWLTYLRNQYTLSIAGSGSGVQTSVGLNTRSDGPLIINRILKLLIILLNSVQQVAASQSARLAFITSWQKAYTDLLTQVRTFSKKGVEGLDNDDVINKLNQTNQQYTSSLQARQQVVSDDAKSLQSTVNNSQDIAQQQGSMITSFIQQLSSILSTIYK